MQQRNIAYDYLRTLAIVLVAILHSWSLLQMDVPEYGVMCYLYRAIVDAGVPLFVLISGALVLSSPIISISDFFKRRLTRVLVPFLIWGTMIYAVAIFRKQYADIHGIRDAVVNWIPYLVYNKINVSHWFVHMIVALYVLTPVLQRVLHAKEGKRMCEYMLVVILGCLILRWFLPQIFIISYCSTLLGYIGLYLAGYYIANYGATFSKVSWCYGIVAIILYIVNVLTKCPNSLLTNLTAVALFGMVVSMQLRRPLPSCKIVVGVSRYSYMIYLIHILIICAIYQFAHIEEPKGWMPLVVGVGVITLCSLGCRLLDLVPGRWKTYLGISK
ncbi:MAG: acyltransferase [Paludibacteraceae bacterium]|nr:acyltransferase [Paludibacteraceae bacterium]